MAVDFKDFGTVGELREILSVLNPNIKIGIETHHYDWVKIKACQVTRRPASSEVILILTEDTRKI